MAHTTSEKQLLPLEIAGVHYRVSRPHRFGLVIEGPAHCSVDPDVIDPDVDPPESDYLHQHLLASENRDSFFDLIVFEKLVVCRNVQTVVDSYRSVHGKSSRGRLSQAEYYHHDGCSCPTKPRLVEIRLPYQEWGRNVATAIAPFRDVLHAMLSVLPEPFVSDQTQTYREQFSDSPTPPPPIELWNKIQGQITRRVRRELDAESCRAYFRDVDAAAGAYVLPWQMGESRLMLNHASNLSETMQHRRAYLQPRGAGEKNGSLVKRWTAEELPDAVMDKRS